MVKKSNSFYGSLWFPVGRRPGRTGSRCPDFTVDTAKFLAGAKFDFDVEVSNAKDLKNVDITINGQNANQFFGQKVEGKDLGNGVVSYRVNQVNFPKTGKYTVRVSATDADGTNSAMHAIRLFRKKLRNRLKTSSSSLVTACPCRLEKWLVSFPKA